MVLDAQTLDFVDVFGCTYGWLWIFWDRPLCGFLCGSCLLTDVNIYVASSSFSPPLLLSLNHFTSWFHITCESIYVSIYLGHSHGGRTIKPSTEYKFLLMSKIIPVLAYMVSICFFFFHWLLFWRLHLLTVIHPRESTLHPSLRGEHSSECALRNKKLKQKKGEEMQKSTLSCCSSDTVLQSNEEINKC